MVMEMEDDMDTVLERFYLLLDRDGRGSSSKNPCEPAAGGSTSDHPSRSGGGGSKEADGGCAVKERIARALRIYKEAATAEEDANSGEHGGVLVQVWAPARDGARRVLATRGQPFVLAAPPQSHRLFQYRTVSLTHAFPVGGPGAAAPGERGMPGRVFDAGTPEWTPNVQFYGTGEYARISYALIYDIQAALALPILDPDSGDCLAVFELVMTSPRLRFAAEVDKLCKALQAVELRGADICCCPMVAEVSNNDEELELAMSEVSGILTTVCEAHQLPLAQTWVRCRRCSTTTGTDHAAALTSAGAPFYVVAAADKGARGFRDACAEQHLRQGRGGLVEEAATARGPRFCADVTKYSMDAYPLAHHARFSGLAGCLAVCVELRPDAGDEGRREECVLEFFLPPDCRDGATQKAMAEAVAATIRGRFGNGELKVVDVCGLQELAFEVVADDECVIRPDDRAIMADTPELRLDDDHGGYERDSEEEEGVHLAAAVGGEDEEAPQTNDVEQKEEEDPKPRSGRRRKKKVGKRKNEKSVSLEELQRYFSGRMKDAARSLGVCPTTMKRICRQHGISRWPFRQIAKANNSLDKVRIFESVQYSPTPPMAVPAASQQAPVPATAHGPPAALPCLSGPLGVASSQGSCCQEPPARKNTTMRKPFHAGSDGLVTVKASYRGDIVRFRVPSSAGVEAVKAEVAKRLSLEMDAFDVKYLDDDNEWVLLSCDADFQECLEVVPALSAASSMPASGAALPVVRLMVQEVADSHGSSCGSSE